MNPGKFEFELRPVIVLFLFKFKFSILQFARFPLLSFDVVFYDMAGRPRGRFLISDNHIPDVAPVHLRDIHAVTSTSDLSLIHI